MAFMALFFWVFIPIILLALVAGALQQVVQWIQLNAALVNWIVVGILAVNVLVIIGLAHLRRRQKWEGKLNWTYIRQFRGLRRVERIIWKLTLYLWPACAGFWALLCVLFLVIQPIRFIPEHFLQIPAAEDCYGQWEITGYRGSTSRTPEEIEPYIGVNIVYEEEQFTADGQVYPLKYVKDYAITSTYQSNTIWKEYKINVPGTVVTRSFDDLGIETKRVGRCMAWLQDDPGEIVLGQLFYILDWDTILVYYDGVFLQAERVK